MSMPLSFATVIGASRWNAAGHCVALLRAGTDLDVIRTILEHLKQRAAPPQRASPARSQDDLFAAS
jgi:hypothetical protein